MSINNLEKTFENNLLIYYNLYNGYIIECICLTNLYLLNKYNNKKFGRFTCNKVKIITIYDFYKNTISEPIQTNLFKDPIKIGDILENLNNIYCFKTFIETFLINNKLNGIKYNTSYNNSEFEYNFSYDNIYIDLHNHSKKITIYKNKNILYSFYFTWVAYHINCYEKKNCITYDICNNLIKINITKKLYYRNISFLKKDLKVIKITVYYKKYMIYYEKRNDNNEITNWKKLNNRKIKKEFISNNTNPPFSKPLKKYCIELINHYNNNINNFIKIFKPIFKKTKEAQYNLLLNYYLEMINFK